MARDKMRFLEEGGVKRLPPECLGTVGATDPSVMRKKSSLARTLKFPRFYFVLPELQTSGVAMRYRRKTNRHTKADLKEGKETSKGERATSR